MSRVKILNVYFHKVSMKEAVNKVINILDNENNNSKMVFTPNPEIVMIAQKQKRLIDVLNNGDLVVPDGIGIVKAAKLLNNPVPERVAGYDLVQGVFEKISKTNKTVYFFGAAPGIVDSAKKIMETKYPGLKIVGTVDGYFDKQREEQIVEDINKVKPDLLLVGLGAPKQEYWIYNNRSRLKVKLCIGVGGSFDVMSGNIKRAPKWMIKLNLEWFYRLIKQPTRIKRMIQLPLFIFKVKRSK
ncbi:MAG: WecB/TagA/CpsF family glycosyltransferase [Eubacteriales bacterium]